MAADHTYSINTCITLHSYEDYAWFKWVGNSGINGGGGYLITSPTSANTVSQQILENGNYAKRSCFTFDITGNGSTSNFFQVEITDYNVGINRACMNVFNVVDTTQATDNSDIINNANQNASNIIDSNNQNTNNIINNNNQNTTTIINNQNQNTDKEIESQKVCSIIDSSNVVIKDKGLNSNGQEVALGSNLYFGITDYISLGSNPDFTMLDHLNGNWGVYYCFYKSDKTLNGCVPTASPGDDTSISVPNGSSYFRATIKTNSNLPRFKLCKNGNQALSDDINDLNNTLNDTTIDGSSIGGKFAEIDTISDTPITDLLTMPLVLLNKLYEGVSGSCTAYVLPFGLLGGNESITLPCFDGQRYLGSAWSIIDGLVCIFMLYNIGMMIVQFFENVTSLQDTFDSMYVPKHTYHPKHGGGK